MIIIFLFFIAKSEIKQFFFTTMCMIKIKTSPKTKQRLSHKNVKNIFKKKGETPLNYI